MSQNGWITVAEIAARFGKAEGFIADLVRSNHWPRVQGASGVLVGVTLDVVERAIGGSKGLVRGATGA